MVEHGWTWLNMVEHGWTLGQSLSDYWAMDTTACYSSVSGCMWHAVARIAFSRQHSRDGRGNATCQRERYARSAAGVLRKTKIILQTECHTDMNCISLNLLHFQYFSIDEFMKMNTSASLVILLPVWLCICTCPACPADRTEPCYQSFTTCKAWKLRSHAPSSFYTFYTDSTPCFCPVRVWR